MASSTKVKELVAGNTAIFEFFRDGTLWYRIGDKPGFMFPIPIDDAKSATFNREVKAITLMRWVRKHLKAIEENKV